MVVQNEKFQDMVLSDLKAIKENVSNLCSRMTKVETNLENHLDYTKQRESTQKERFYKKMAILGFAATAVSLGIGALNAFLGFI